jgi:hypothetical protein
MEVTERKQIPQSLYPYVKVLKFSPKSPIKLMGSSGLKSQQYFSDYDLFSTVDKTDCEKIYRRLLTILKNTSKWVQNPLGNPEMYFIEFKLQTKDGKKLRRLDKFKLFCEYFKNVDFIKLDFVIRLENRFIELSIIYSFGKQDKIEDYKSSLNKDIRELMKEGKYYKVLKRIFSMRAKEPKNPDRDRRLIQLTRFFNSEYGKMYQDVSNLRAIETLSKQYKDELTKRKIEQNLKDLKLSIKDADRLEKEYNAEAFNLIK